MCGGIHFSYQDREGENGGKGYSERDACREIQSVVWPVLIAEKFRS